VLFQSRVIQSMSSSISSTAPEASSAKRFTDELREAAGDQWQRVIAHRFTAELASGDIDRTVLKRYLIQDHLFLDAFVVLLASIVAKAPTLEDRIPGCQFLGMVTSQENTYFERAFDKLGVTLEERQSTPTHPVTTKFIHQMRNTAENGTFG
jgi:thiaminase/transcriptional activator TenA